VIRDAHLPVLVAETLEALRIVPHGRYVDATFGRGGHAGAILDRLGEDGRMLAMDRDPEAIRAARERFALDGRVMIRQGPFSMLGDIVRECGWMNKVNGILLDLGVSSPQLDEAARGFSFLRDGPLDMRMDPGAGQSAAEWVATAPEADIARVIRDYGEERFARGIARAIVQARAVAPIERTQQLADIVAAAVRTREPGQHPATRTFQAIRIHINRELDELRSMLPQACDALAPGGRLAVIAFHSLEDRIVKDFLRHEAKGDPFPPDMPVTHDRLAPRLRVIGKPVRASEAEIARNPRARSATLRVAEKLDA
jgi:16S rRNA (cytosine1402-N4)-methyltransferase